LQIAIALLGDAAESFLAAIETQFLGLNGLLIKL
jgi:hypothetical protein